MKVCNCTMFVNDYNIERFLYTVTKFQVVNQPILNSSSFVIILTTSWKKIYSVFGGVVKRRSPIQNTFSFNAVNIMPYCHLYIAFSFVS